MTNEVIGKNRLNTEYLSDGTHSDHAGIHCELLTRQRPLPPPKYQKNGMLNGKRTWSLKHVKNARKFHGTEGCASVAPFMIIQFSNFSSSCIAGSSPSPASPPTLRLVENFSIAREMLLCVRLNRFDNCPVVLPATTPGRAVIGDTAVVAGTVSIGPLPVSLGRRDSSSWPLPGSENKEADCIGCVLRAFLINCPVYLHLCITTPNRHRTHAHALCNYSAPTTCGAMKDRGSKRFGKPWQREFRRHFGVAAQNVCTPPSCP